MPDATATLLWEVGCEELPAWACDQVLAQLPALVQRELAAARLLGDGASGEPVVHVGPRRFSVLVNVLTATRALDQVQSGPPVKIAFAEDGAPTRAAEGFARKLGIDVSALEVVDGVVTARVSEPSIPFASAWPAIAGRLLADLNFTKPMRWGTGQHRFIRPVRWIVTLLGHTPVEYELWGVRSGASSRTHRFLSSEPTVTVGDPEDYPRLLADHHVIVDQQQRRHTIEQGLGAAAQAFGGQWSDPGNVLREVVHLVEYPTVLTGRFDERYLELPERVLVTAMQSHQRYVAIRTDEGLAPAFLTVMNGSPAAIDTILPGYERVLQGRLDDAVFSFGRDRSRGLDDMATDASLGAVVFHARAGSLADRRDRIVAAADALARQCGVDRERARLAAHLAKADQVSYVVQEFAELEGFAGSLYARAAGHPDDVCAAVDQQFRPRSAEADLPDPGVPAIVALADKIELLVTMFAIGEQPTGSRDPHALRRAAIGVMRVVLEHDLPVDLVGAITAVQDVLSSQRLGEVAGESAPAVREFVLDRVEKRLTDGGVRVDAVRAARSAGLPRLQQLDGLARALDAGVREGSHNFLSVVAALTRCVRILEKSASDAATTPNPDGFEADSERDLLARLANVGPAVHDAVDTGHYAGAVEAAAALGPEVDAFFDRETGVMVMADDPALRANRLALVAAVVAALAPLGDLTELQG